MDIKEIKEKIAMTPKNWDLEMMEASRDASDEEIRIVKELAQSYFEDRETLQRMLMAADERLKIVKVQRDELDRQVEDFKNALSNRDHEFSEVKEENAKKNQAINSALSAIMNLPENPTEDDYRKCLNDINRFLGI